MKNKKKAILFTAALLLLAALGAGVFLMRPDKVYIPPKPEDTQLEFWICEDTAGTDWSGHDMVEGGFGCEEYLGKAYSSGESVVYELPEVCVSYRMTAWPDYADGGWYVTRIKITDPAVSVYGVTLDSDPRDFERVMKSLGFKITLKTAYYCAAQRDGFTFALSQGMYIQLVAEVTNRDGIIF